MSDRSVLDIIQFIHDSKSLFSKEVIAGKCPEYIDNPFYEEYRVAQLLHDIHEITEQEYQIFMNNHHNRQICGLVDRGLLEVYQMLNMGIDMHYIAMVYMSHNPKGRFVAKTSIETMNRLMDALRRYFFFDNQEDFLMSIGRTDIVFAG
ncbi:hypothetical protein D1872_37850 [compost metagenome]